MKKIIMDKESKLEVLEQELQKVQGKSTARTLYAVDIADILTYIGENLKLPKKALAGVEIEYTGAEHFPNAYRFTPISTHFHAVHNGRAWVIDSITRDTCPNRENNYAVTLTEEAKTAIIKRFTAGRVW